MATTVEVCGERTRIAISGRFSPSDVADGKQRLLEALELKHPVDLDLSELAEGDASLIQLLLSARRSAEAQKVDLRLVQHGYAFVQVLSRLGFDNLLNESWLASSECVQFFLFHEESA